MSPEDVAAQRQALAQAAKARGDVALDAGRPAEALQAYDEAYALHPLPALLYNRARAFEKMGRFPEALEQLERFAREADAELKAKVPKLGELAASYRAKTTRLFLTVEPSTAEVRLGERLLGSGPLVQLVVNAGPDAPLVVTAEGHFTSTQRLALPGGGDVHVKVALGSKATDSVLRVEGVPATALATVNPGQDGEQKGSTPLEALVKPGTHLVRLVSQGYLPAETSVVVGLGEVKVVRVALRPEPRFYERWYFWAAVGAVVVAASVVGVAWLVEQPLPRGTLNRSEPPLAPAALPTFTF